MLTLEECRKLLQDHIDKENVNSSRKSGLTAWFEQGEFCYAFRIEPLKYIETGDTSLMGIGAGPTLIDRRDGRIISMANHGSMENYEKRGNPHNGLSGILQISGRYSDGIREDVFRHFRKVTGKPIKETRDLIDSLITDGSFVFDTNAWREQDILEYIRGFKELGLNVKRLTTFEAYPDKSK